jgi:hypothetical protein
MSRFYLTSVNSRGNTVTAMGRKDRQDCHLRGWNGGVEVRAYATDDDEDQFDVYATSGSTGTRRTLIARVDRDGNPIPIE